MKRDSADVNYPQLRELSLNNGFQKGVHHEKQQFENFA